MTTPLKPSLEEDLVILDDPSTSVEDFDFVQSSRVITKEAGRSSLPSSPIQEDGDIGSNNSYCQVIVSYAYEI